MSPYDQNLIRRVGQRSVAKHLIPCIPEQLCQQIAAELQAMDAELADVFLNPRPWQELRLTMPPTIGMRSAADYGYRWGLHYLTDLLSDATLIAVENAINMYIQRYYWRFAEGWFYAARRKRQQRSLQFTPSSPN